jgi:signal transduction histidine kinase
MIRRWLRDTLFKRLFALMWVALVVSHLVAFFVVTRGPHAPPGHAGATLPVLPSLPPTPGLSGPAAGGPGPRPADGPPPPPAAQRRPDSGGPELPAADLLLDYGIRLLLIGVAAWWGARWLAVPMRRLVGASRDLAQALAQGHPVPRLDERRGTQEVREAAHVFNDMARQLDEQFRARALLVAAISHDLRTPLTRMRMRLESSADPEAARSIADIREMDALLESALDVFRAATSPEAPQLTDVHALVQSLTDDLQELGQPVQLQGEPVLARVQPRALRRVVDNLLGNALRYGGSAEVSVSRTPTHVRIEIDDRGPGIPPAQLEAVFQPFFRVESSRSRATGGTGLGLYIARDLVQRQGGTLTLANRPEGGLRASVALPLG